MGGGQDEYRVVLKYKNIWKKALLAISHVYDAA